MESHTVPPEPSVSIDALETFVELLSRVEADPASDAFYSRLCEATCRVGDMDRAVIFRYAFALLGDGAEGVGYLLKERLTDGERFVDAVRRVAAGESVLDPEVVAHLLG